MREISINEVPNSLLREFDCGELKLNTYLKNYARQNFEKGVGKTFLLVDDKHVLGFYTLCSAQIKFEELPLKICQKLPKYPIPAIIIARFAVNKIDQSKGIGSLLLTNAFRRIVSAFTNIGITFIVVDAKKESKGFYEHFGFKCVNEENLTYILSIFTVIKAVSDI